MKAYDYRGVLDEACDVCGAFQLESPGAITGLCDACKRQGHTKATLGSLQGWASTPARDVLYYDRLAREAWSYSDGQRVFIRNLPRLEDAKAYAKRHGFRIVEVA